MRTIEDHAKALADGSTTSRALVEQCLARIADPGGEGARAFIKVHAETGTRDGRCDGYAAPRRARTKPLCRHSDRPEGPVRHRRRSHTGRLARAGRRAARRRARTRRAAHAGGRLRADGPHQHDRVRLLRSRHQSALRHAVLALGPRVTTHSRRQFLGHGGVGLRRHGGRRSGHRYRRFLPHPGGVLRHCRLQAHRAPRADHRGAAAGAESGFRGTAGTECRVLRGDRCGTGGRDTGAAGAGRAERPASGGPEQRRARRNGCGGEQRVRPRARHAVAGRRAHHAYALPRVRRGARGECQRWLRRLRSLCLAPLAACGKRARATTLASAYASHAAST